MIARKWDMLKKVYAIFGNLTRAYYMLGTINLLRLLRSGKIDPAFVYVWQMRYLIYEFHTMYKPFVLFEDILNIASPVFPY